MILQTGLVASAIAVAYALAKRRLSVEVSLLVSAVVGGLAGAVAGAPPITELARHLVEGAFTYLDIVLIFVTATIFMAIVREAGGVDYLVRGIIRRFHSRRILALLLLMVIVLIPGALTGAGSISLLVVGAPVALALKYLGVAPVRVAALLFILAGLSAAAPPVNVWAMITCAGTAIPYVGFELPLAVPILLLGVATVLFFGWRGKPVSVEQALAEMPAPPAGLRWWHVVLPFLVFFGLVVATRVWPFAMPTLGLPLDFAIAALVAWLVSPKKANPITVSTETVRQLLPLLATLVVVGILQQIMTATGVRGLLAFAVISAPLLLLYAGLAVVIPLSEAVLAYGGAAVFGIPLAWFFDSIGLHATVVIAALSLLWALGDGLPPTALIGRLGVMVSGYTGSYGAMLKQTWLPWLLITATSILMIVFSRQLSFLVEWSL